MNDEPKPSTQNPTPSTLWKDLVAAEAANGRAQPGREALFVVQEIRQEHYDEIREYQHFLLRAPDGEQILYHRDDVYCADVHSAYTTGIKHERLYQLHLLSKQRERKWLAIGAALFFGFCAGILLAAGMNWLL